MEFLTVSFGGKAEAFTSLGDLPENSFRGVASVFGGLVDAYIPTIIHKGAFAKTLQEQGRGVKILWQHDPTEPIGVPSLLVENEFGLVLQAKISTTQRGQECLQLIRDGVVDGLSIGFDPIKFDYEEINNEMVRHIREVRLWEVSAVTWGADSAARITEVNSLAGKYKSIPGTITQNGALQFHNLPVASLTTPWQAGDVKEWSGAVEKPTAKYGRAFIYGKNTFESFKFQIAEVIDGELTVVPSAVFEAALAALSDVDMSDEENERVRFHLERYFAKMRKQFKDETFVAPWEPEVLTALHHYTEKDALMLLGSHMVTGSLSLAEVHSALSLVSGAVPSVETHTLPSEDVDQLLMDAELAFGSMQVESL